MAMVAHQLTDDHPSQPRTARGKRRGKRRSYAGAALASELDKVGLAAAGAWQVLRGGRP